MEGACSPCRRTLLTETRKWSATRRVTTYHVLAGWSRWRLWIIARDASRPLTGRPPLRPNNPRRDIAAPEAIHLATIWTGSRTFSTRARLRTRVADLASRARLTSAWVSGTRSAAHRSRNAIASGTDMYSVLRFVRFDFFFVMGAPSTVQSVERRAASGVAGPFRDHANGSQRPARSTCKYCR